MASVLIVDDDAKMLDFLCATLAGAGHAVRRATSGTDALQILDDVRKPLDLLLADIVMPGLHGFNLALMARLRRPDIKVLYITGYPDLEIVAAYSGPRLGRMLEKPLAPEQLRVAVERALSERAEWPDPDASISISRYPSGDRT